MQNLTASHIALTLYSYVHGTVTCLTINHETQWVCWTILMVQIDPKKNQGANNLTMVKHREAVKYRCQFFFVFFSFLQLNLKWCERSAQGNVLLADILKATPAWKCSRHWSWVININWRKSSSLEETNKHDTAVMLPPKAKQNPGRELLHY